MEPGPEKKWGARLESPEFHVPPTPPTPYLSTPPGRTPSEQVSLGPYGQPLPVGKRNPKPSCSGLMISGVFFKISKSRFTVLKWAGQHLAKFRASQALLIQMALNMAVLPCARLCAKHITCLLPTATFPWSKVVPWSEVADRGGTPNSRDHNHTREPAPPRGQDEAFAIPDLEVGCGRPLRAAGPRPAVVSSQEGSPCVAVLPRTPAAGLRAKVRGWVTGLVLQELLRVLYSTIP